MGVKKSFATKLLISRGLTRSGDQAWDFAVPITLLTIFPGQLRLAAIYFLLTQIFLVLLLPRVASLIDSRSRIAAVRIGIGLQLCGVVLGSFSLYTLYLFSQDKLPLSNPSTLLTCAVLIFSGVLSTIGASFMNISIANDLVPSGFTESELSKFNSRLRQVDLLTEVFSPIIAGTILLFATENNPLLGFLIIAAWNIVSFFPEYGFLRSIFQMRPDLVDKSVQVSAIARMPMFKRLSNGWASFFKEPVAPVVAVYALLWLSVLSPHGVLLTVFLKDGWNLPEAIIGTFRGLGALFGLAATLIFPWVVAKFKLIPGARLFLTFQSVSVVLALICFFMGGSVGQMGFLGFILLSRIGLYGFSLGEMQVRQIGIRPEMRGEINGFANGLTALATLMLYLIASLLPTAKEFSVLVVGSCLAVLVATLLFWFWSVRQKVIE